ncbi:hypothetical protein [Streptomyces hoynatensis]|uniref:Uncharacterized protein n=1 Tax=Streptomyces hoynatensis TaxID=1141874 RepID=A0A3A9Z9L2_9ACTN|nr:hypothetical protein [Streptomyces hoynatensis]RKN44006.1 hypothetical protein D7294_10040 [Streptomyces hoynatensis]
MAERAAGGAGRGADPGARGPGARHGGEAGPGGASAQAERIVALDVALGARGAAPFARRVLAAARSAHGAPGGGTPERGACGERGAAGQDGAAGQEGIAAAARLYQVAGWTLFDAGEHAAARLLYRRALALCRGLDAAGASPELLVRSLMSMQEEQLGRPERALRLASSALAREDLPPRVAAMFHLRRAPAYARLRRRDDALRSLRTARELLAEGPRADDPPWAWWLDQGELLGHHGLVHAALGDPEAAAPFLHEAAAPGGGPAYRAVFATGLAHLLAGLGAWRDTASCLSALAESSRPLGSARALASLAGALALVESGRGVPRGLRDTAHHLAACHAPAWRALPAPAG